MLGAACGDALGWPNERVAKSKAKKPPLNRTPEFTRWSRRAGGRFYSHEEIIDAGHYSDDTQLILCLSRGLKHGKGWWRRWTRVELPFWTLYERGGGGATKRAANSWISGNTPWSGKRNFQDVKKYFEAGGNGVAMRVLPHAIYLSESDDHKILARNIMLDGVATHGHPRALVGGLAYGRALWRTLRRNERLEYGGIVDDLLNNIELWSPIPDISKNCPDWLKSANRFSPNYQQLWEQAVQEITSYLSICKKELNKGALTIDDEALRAIRCFDRKVSGAGTVAAAAAAYLASRYAPNPIQGVIKAAFAIGSDTDTIASMTGALLGGVNGATWLEPYDKKVQDAKYLKKTAENLVGKGENARETDLSGHTTFPILRKADLNNWISDLRSANQGDTIDLPDLRKAQISKTFTLGASVKNVEIVSWLLKSNDGQSLFVKKISRARQPSSSKKIRTQEDVKTAKAKMDASPKSVTRLGVKLRVQDMRLAKEFYNRILGLRIARETRNIISFEGIIAIVPSDYGKDFDKAGASKEASHSILYIETREFERVFDAVRKSGNQIMAKITEWSGQRFFRCADPDGNVIEVFGAGYKPDLND